MSRPSQAVSARPDVRTRSTPSLPQRKAVLKKSAKLGQLSQTEQNSRQSFLLPSIILYLFLVYLQNSKVLVRFMRKQQQQKSKHILRFRIFFDTSREFQKFSEEMNSFVAVPDEGFQGSRRFGGADIERSMEGDTACFRCCPGHPGQTRRGILIDTTIFKKSLHM